MLTARGTAGQDVDMEYHLQQATKAFWANKRILLDRGARLGDRLKYFDVCVSGVACFASGHRTTKHRFTPFGCRLVAGVARDSSCLEREGAYVHRTVTNPNLGRPVVQPILDPCTAYLPRVSEPLGPTNSGLEPAWAT